jgi:methylated-DNA-[protein]-cysteine S-methyltransferase
MSRNTLPILIPCHRVLPAGGKLGNYTGGEGPLSKEKLLSFEKSFLGAEKGHDGSLT